MSKPAEPSRTSAPMIRESRMFPTSSYPSSGQSTQCSCTSTQARPRWAATAATCRVWFDWTPPMETSVSQPCASASAARYSSLRVLLPPYARPELQSSRLAQISTRPPRCSASRSRRCSGEGPKRTGPRSKLSRLTSRRISRLAKPLLTAEAAAADGEPDVAELPASPPADIRRERAFGFARNPLRALTRRAASIASLVFLDLSGLALGLYIALVLRWLYYEHSVLWGVPWRAETTWLPFLMLVLLLVFWRNGLYTAREFRGGPGRVVGSLALVTVLALAFGLGTGYRFHTYTLAPTALAITALLIGLFRASYDIVTKDVLRLTGARRRAVLVGKGENVAHLRRTLGVGRSGIDYEFLGAVAPDAEGVGLPVLGSPEALAEVLHRHPVDELILTDSDFDERELLDMVEEAHRR